MLHAILEQEHLVDNSQYIGAMRNQDNRRTGILERPDCRKQSQFTGFVKIRVGLIQSDNSRQSVERAGQSNTLFLPARQLECAGTKNGFIALREMQHHLVNAGHPRSLDHLDRIHFTKAGDILGD